MSFVPVTEAVLEEENSLAKLLAALKASLGREPHNAVAVYDSVEALLVFLVIPSNDTGENCRQVDIAVCRALADCEPSDLPKELAGIIEGLGGILHDTHSAPHIARNFESTPNQLLARLRSIPRS